MFQSRIVLYLVFGLFGLLLLPLLVIVALAGTVLGLAVIAIILASAGLSLVFEFVDRLVRRTRVRLTAQDSVDASVKAEELGVPMVEAVRPPGTAFEATIILGEGTCPLFRKKGDIWRVEADGRLSAPLCTPAAAAVQRLIRREGYRSGSSEHCVCPLGAQSVTYLVTAA